MLICSGPPMPPLVRPRRVPELIASCGWSPARTCALVTLRVMPLWLTGNSSLSDAAVAGASSSIVGMIETTSQARYREAARAVAGVELGQRAAWCGLALTVTISTGLPFWSVNTTPASVIRALGGIGGIDR